MNPEPYTTNASDGVSGTPPPIILPPPQVISPPAAPPSTSPSAPAGADLLSSKITEDFSHEKGIVDILECPVSLMLKMLVFVNIIDLLSCLDLSGCF